MKWKRSLRDCEMEESKIQEKFPSNSNIKTLNFFFQTGYEPKKK